MNDYNTRPVRGFRPSAPTTIKKSFWDFFVCTISTCTFFSATIYAESLRTLPTPLLKGGNMKQIYPPLPEYKGSLGKAILEIFGLFVLATMIGMFFANWFADTKSPGLSPHTTEKAVKSIASNQTTN